MQNPVKPLDPRGITLVHKILIEENVSKSVYSEKIKKALKLYSEDAERARIWLGIHGYKRVDSGDINWVKDPNIMEKTLKEIDDMNRMENT